MVSPHILVGNSDTRTAEVRALDAPIIVRRVRIVPLSNTTRTVCLRLELYGCVYEDHNEKTIDYLQSYSAPSGSDVVDGNFVDSTYDGSVSSNGINFGGLGRLSDGIIGTDLGHFPRHWVGWRTSMFTEWDDRIPAWNRDDNDWSGQHHIRFVDVTCFRFWAFSRALLSFSVNGADFSSRSLDFTTEPPTSTSWIRIPIPHRVASVIQLRLYFGTSSSYLLLSEVRFESSACSSELIHIADADNQSENVIYFSIGESDVEHRIDIICE
ncbi:hypothetical protein DICVIV_06895 [Dictyocaulus viviparus]|uniref:F5/8 type C domain-containing protein n=1 Tax=Dictyocaulus viviparus TaxID=29172 RepID=A0A0D8XQU1_DICVI|nr:hypothetical protein DICVIV_06895 [Dictyocaulus viviparus]